MEKGVKHGNFNMILALCLWPWLLRMLDVSKFNIAKIWTTIFVWYMVRCGFKTRHQTNVLRRDWTTSSKYTNHSRFNWQHDWGGPIWARESSVRDLKKERQIGYDGHNLHLLITWHICLHVWDQGSLWSFHKVVGGKWLLISSPSFPWHFICIT